VAGGEEGDIETSTSDMMAEPEPTAWRSPRSPNHGERSGRAQVFLLQGREIVPEAGMAIRMAITVAKTGDLQR